MADAQDTGAGDRSNAPSAEERSALLNRAVKDLTREARASVRSQGEFEAVLVRGTPVNNRLHASTVGVMAILAAAVSLGSRAGLSGLALALVVPGVYALFWLFLVMTGGEELETVSVDETGRVAKSRTGRSISARGDFLRVAIPAVVIAVSGWYMVTLAHDIAFPPPPRCNLPAEGQPQACFSLPRISDLVHASANLAGPSATPGATQAPVAGSDAPVGAFSTQDTIQLERAVRAFLLLVALVFLLPAIWFLRRMLTGQRVGHISPMRHRPGE